MPASNAPAPLPGQAARPFRVLLVQLLKLSWPLAVVQVGQVTMGLVDTALLGRIDANALAASGIGNSIFFVFAVLGMGIIFGAETLISQAVGAQRFDDARRGYHQALVVAVVLFPCFAGGIALASWAITLSDLPPVLVSGIRAYLEARIPGVLALFLYSAIRSYLQADGKTGAITLAVVLANVVNLPLDAVLIFGDKTLLALGIPAQGLPALGVAGAGWATTASTFIQVGVVLGAVRALSRRHQGNPSPHDWLWQAARHHGLRRLVRIGLPVGLQYMVEVGVFALTAFLMARFSTTDGAAFQVGLILASVTFSVALGVSMATSVVVGQRIGAGDQRGSLHAGLAGFGLGAGFMALCASFFLLFPVELASMFSDDPRVIERAAQLLRIAAVFQLSDGLQAVGAGALRGAGDTQWSFLTNLVGHWVIGLPCGLVLAHTTSLKAAGLWWGLTVGLTFTAIVLTLRFWRSATRGYAAVDG